MIPSDCGPLVKKIQVVKGLKEMKVHEGETVTMEVELSQPDVEAFWTKDGQKLRASPKILITVKGTKHSLTMSQLKIDDGGMITFQAEDVRSSAKLVVTGTSIRVRLKLNLKCLNKKKFRAVFYGLQNLLQRSSDH